MSPYLLLALSLVSISLCQNNWRIECGYYNQGGDLKWTVLRCIPGNLTINVGDIVTLTQNRSSNAYTLNTAQRGINFETFELNELCVLGRIQLFGASPPNSAVFPPDFLMTINSTTTRYSSGLLFDVAPESIQVYTSGEYSPPPPALVPTWPMKFVTPGTYTYNGCFEWFITGTINVLPAGQPLPKTPAQVDQDIAAEHAQLKAKIVELEDINAIGDGKYGDPERFENEEGFTHHVIKVGFGDPETGLSFYGYHPPSITITEGDTVAYEAQWYTGPLDDPWPLVHTVRFNVSVNDSNWQARYYDDFAAVVHFAIPLPDGSLYFLPYFPFYLRETFLGLFDAPSTWTTYWSDPRNFGNGQLSLGGIYAKVKRGWQNYRNVTFVNPGTFKFVCHLHIPINMRGTIQVDPRPRSDRDKFHVDKTFERLTRRHFIDFMESTYGVTYASHIRFSFLMADHGILSYTLEDGSLKSDPLLVAFRIKFTVIDNNNMTQSEFDDFGNGLISFVAAKTWTFDEAWTFSTFVDEQRTRTATTVEAVYTLQYSSAALVGSSLICFISVLLLLF